ncbi:unnamed protein product [Closterium sp. NIES-54]
MLLALPAPRTSRSAAACESRPAALPSSQRPAALQPVHRSALPLGPRTALPCSSRAALPCPAAQRVTPCCPAQWVTPCCPAQRVTPYCPARRALLQPARRALQLRTSRTAALRVAPCCSPRVAPYCSPRVTLCCLARRALLPCTARALLPCQPRALPCSPRRALPCPAAPPSLAEPRRPARAALPNPSRAALPRSPAPPSRPAATIAAAATRPTAVAGGGTAGSARSAAGAGGAGAATGSAGGAAGAGGAGPTTDRHCLSWPLSWQLQRLGVDSGGHCLSWTTPPLSSFASGFFSEPRCVTGSVEAAALGASESAAALGASESTAALGASDRPAATTAAAATRATAVAGGGTAGSAGSAAGAGGAGAATGSAGGAAGAGGAGPTTDRHCLSWPLSWQLQWLGVDSGDHCLSWTTPPLSSFASGFFSEPVQVVEALVFCVLHRGGSRAAALGASESAAALGASESAAALGASESTAALGASESAAALGASESAAAQGASESAAPLGARASPATGPSSVEALHTFTLDSGTSRCFFGDCTALTPLAAPVPVSLADPAGGPVVARASTVLPCPVVPSGFVRSPPPHVLPLVSNTAIQDAWVYTFIPGGQRVAICACARPGVCRYTSSRTLVSGLPRYLPPLPPGPAPTCVPCVEGRQRAAPHSSEFPPKEDPLQTLHMDVWGPARVRGQGHERYFLLVVDDYSRYTTVFPLRSKGETFTLPASPQQNGIAVRRIGMVMDIARTSMIHAAAPHFLWPFAVQYAVHQINLQPRDSLPETTPTLWWTGKVGDASAFRVWGSRAFVRDTVTPRPRALTYRRLRVPTPLSGRQPWMPRWHPGSPQAPTLTRFLHLGQT